MSNANRKDIRAAIAADLTAALVPALVDVVYAGQVADFKHQSPAVVVSSAGSDRTNETYATQGTVLFVDVGVFVLYSDAEHGWSELDAENRLDDIETAVSEWVAMNPNRAPSGGVGWTDLAYAGRTGADIGPASLGGQDYRYEQISLRVTIGGAV